MTGYEIVVAVAVLETWAGVRLGGVSVTGSLVLIVDCRSTLRPWQSSSTLTWADAVYWKRPGHWGIVDVV